MPLIRLGDIARPVNRFETVRPDREYPLLGMRSRIGGPFLRETKSGAEMSASRLNKVEPGDLIYSRLFAWQGSFGLIPPSLGNCYVSSEFPLFTLDLGRVVPEYLVLWFGLGQVQQRVEADCRGSTPGTRNRYKEEHFLRLSIDLPDVASQERIVTRIGAVTERIGVVNRLRQEILDDGNALLHSIFRRIVRGARYIPFAEAATVVRRPVPIHEDGEYPEVAVRSFGKGTFHKPTLSGANLQWQKLFRVNAGDLLISNIKAWEGAIAIAGSADHGRVGSHRYITCTPRPGLATAEFLCFYLLSPEGLEQVQAASPGSADRNRTLARNRLQRLRVPLPPIAGQLEFTRLYATVGAARNAQSASQSELDALLPAVLDKAFKGQL